MRKTVAGLLDGGVVNVYAYLYCVCSSAASGPANGDHRAYAFVATTKARLCISLKACYVG
jgi:hypothetical protein